MNCCLFQEPATLDGRWHFIVGTYGNSIQTLYVDGKIVGSRTAPSSLIKGTATPTGLYIGTLENKITYGTGQVDLPMIYASRTLTVADVQQLYVDPYCFLQPQSPRKLWMW